jgi:CheY-like chemotaxis protein
MLVMDGRNILLVDDDADDQFIFTYAVKEIDSHAHCECINNAEKALETLRNNRSEKYDYIFLDLNLPLMDGLSCLEKIRKNENLNDVPIVIYSTSNRPQDMQKAKELGAKDYIQKPSTFDELVKMIQKVLQ